MTPDDARFCLDAWSDGWARMDLAALASLTDRDDPSPHYVPEEVEDAPFTSWAAIDRYWAEAARLFPAGVRLEAGAITISRPAPDLAALYFPMRWALVPPGGPGVAGENRVSQLWRLRPAGWRLIHHVEAPLAMVPWVLSLCATKAREAAP
jgi:hypothetical protein